MYKFFTKMMILVMLLGTMLIAILEFSNNNFSRLLTFLALIPILAMPLLLSFTKFKLNSKEIFLYYIFIFLADFLGCVVNLYNNISWYDLFVHFLSGIFTFILAYIILDKLNLVTNSKFLNIIFCLGFVAIIAICWEIFEYIVDNLLNVDLQHNLTTGVNDTMGDMIVALSGGIIATIYYYFKGEKSLCKKY